MGGSKVWKMFKRFTKRFHLLVAALVLLILMFVFWLARIAFEDYVLSRVKEANAAHHWDLYTRFMYLATTYPVRSAIVIACAVVVLSEFHLRAKSYPLWKAAFGDSNSEEESLLKENTAKARNADLPPNRPCVIPAEYGKDPKRIRLGLFVVNPGYIALDVHIPSVALGSSGYTLEFPETLPQLGERDHRCFMAPLLNHPTLPGSTGSGLFDVMRRFDIDSFGFTIQYKDLNSVWYRSNCTIERDVGIAGGIRVGFVGQELMPPKPVTPGLQPNLHTDFSSGPIGPIYLTPEGVWSASYSASSVKWTGLRMKVSNEHISGKVVRSATDVSVRIKFEHDTGLDAGSAAPTAWLHEKRGYVEIKAGEEKQAIVAVCSESEWYTVTNTRDASGYPPNTSAMHFQEAPWFSGKLHIALIMAGEAVAEEHYSWEVAVTNVGGIPRSGIPHIRPFS